MILEKINSPQDVKGLREDEVHQLCNELRQFLVEQVSKTGGHLASNLGTVELTVAIHRVFDTGKDRLVFDVGHQCYVHKALTGRRELFSTLRQFEGLSGFPKPYESQHDAFIGGHASNSVSVALGMARARTLQHKDYNVLALIGDGAMGGGLSFEGLNNAGESQEPLIVILNDNGMSINPNVGGMSRHLARLRERPRYYQFKKWYRQALDGSRVGQKIYETSHDMKTILKNSVFPDSTMFESMGFTYMGPVDGHDVEKLTQMLTWAKELRCPVVIHVQTMKGKGYPFAEDEPGRFHGIAPFDPATGKTQSGSPSFSQVFGQELTHLAERSDKICAITAAMEDGTGLTGFARQFPKRFFDVGIAEGHAVAMAAGMAKQGMLPVFAVYSSFLQRGFDMMLHDVALDGLHVVLAVDRSGLVGADGETHHGCFDVQYLSTVPGMTVLSPASFEELRKMLQYAIQEVTGPIAVRYPRGGEGAYQGCCGREIYTELRQGGDCTIVSYGILINQAIAAAELLSQRGIEARVVKLNQIAPLSAEVVCQMLEDTEILLVLEDCVNTGCVGQRLGAMLAQQGKTVRLILKNTGDTFTHQGKVEQLYHAIGLDAEGVAGSVEEVLREQ
ncbi:MAG: 1-deoxy-D-xylulose-5-phosphate synthase [Clostridiales bacterium]|nr:1-deoxy-D-xylulose-5-phosphate synthase [Candidatus Cacconaster stercorequi]